ncbi:MAG: hypothetical protein J6P73_07585 [Bacteroidales bacterium]|nr:hypothetical protein [Bacteroidales bacterium]
MKKITTLALLLLFAMTSHAHSVVEKRGNYKITHEWMYNGTQWSCEINIPVGMYRYYQRRAHKSDDMVQFVLSDYDRQYLRGLVTLFRERGAFEGYTDRDNLGNVISFVQSLQYITDMDSKWEDEYVRFPVETLVDGKGDCEDMSVLAAAILHEMGYDVKLVALPDHLALAVDCDCEGTYYAYEGKKYYYVEVTNPGWAIGQIPDQFRSAKVKLSSLVYRPKVRLKRSSYRNETYHLGDYSVPFWVQCQLENAGPGTTKDLSVRVLFSAYGGDTVAERVFKLDELMEGVSASHTFVVDVPRPMRGSLEIRVEGANFVMESMKFANIDLQ